MILRHYAHGPIEALSAREQDSHFKPHGLWVSEDSDPETSWPGWCAANDFGGGWSHVYDVTLADDANVLVLSTAFAIDDFTREYGAKPNRPHGYIEIDWSRVAREYDGIVIAPYQWSRRMTDHTMWYYSWDCASGCIWNPRAIGSFTLREMAEAA